MQQFTSKYKTCPNISYEDERNLRGKNLNKFGCIFEEKYLNYREYLSTQQTELCNRPGVSIKNGFLRMEAESKDF